MTCYGRTVAAAQGHLLACDHRVYSCDNLIGHLLDTWQDLESLRATIWVAANLTGVERQFHRLVFASACMVVDQLRAGEHPSGHQWFSWCLTLSHWREKIGLLVTGGLLEGERVKCLGTHVQFLYYVVCVCLRMSDDTRQSRQGDSAVLQCCTHFHEEKGPVYLPCWHPGFTLAAPVFSPDGLWDSSVSMDEDLAVHLGGFAPLEHRVHRLQKLHLREHVVQGAKGLQTIGFMRPDHCNGPGRGDRFGRPAANPKKWFPFAIADAPAREEKIAAFFRAAVKGVDSGAIALCFWEPAVRPPPARQDGGHYLRDGLRVCGLVAEEDEGLSEALDTHFSDA